MAEDNLFEKLGGEDGIRALVDSFYDYMDNLPEARGVREMHPPDLKTSREKFALFLVGWTGGPQLYMERFGHPRLRMRHLPFAIDESARDQWMLCMRRALEETVEDPAVREYLNAAFYRVADFMRNTETR